LQGAGDEGTFYNHSVTPAKAGLSGGEGATGEHALQRRIFSS
jgi:hypothetical protein